MNRLKPKVARVTWGAVGLGRASVIRMAEEVAKVAILNSLETGGIGLVAYLKAKKQ
jgi:NAD(P)-dependent dehydrogenase (short-subunit alcohol dehydrogenase family)